MAKHDIFEMMLNMILLLLVLSVLFEGAKRVNGVNSSNGMVPSGVNVFTNSLLAPVKNVLGSSSSHMKKCTMYYRDSCPYCKKQKDMLSEAGLLNHPNFAMVDCAVDGAACANANPPIKGIPHFMVVLSNGDKLSVSGLQPVDKVEGWLNN